MFPPMHPVLTSWLKLRNHLSDDFLGGPKKVPLNWVINFQKGGTLPLVLGIMAWHHNNTTTAWTYAALHGSYGLIWLLKEMIFPDIGWSRRVTIGGAINGFVLVLGLYWLAPWLLIRSHLEQPPMLLAAATLLYAVGVVIMVGADAQKYFVLRRTPGLITDGFFARIRHPNYLGEMMVYGAFAIVAGHASRNKQDLCCRPKAKPEVRVTVRRSAHRVWRNLDIAVALVIISHGDRGGQHACLLS